MLLQQIHGAVEEDTLKVHLEQIVLTWEKVCAQKAVRAPSIFGLLFGFLLWTYESVHFVLS